MSKIIEAIINLVAVIVFSIVSLIGMCLDFAFHALFYGIIILLIAKCAGF
tara:strand:+ start:453 stop:602 length:150 start_codon:yes stop_codon:yes gene_type:complete